MSFLKKTYTFVTKHCNVRSLSNASSVKIVEVGPRDGLQNEQKVLSTDIKLQLIDDLAKAGLTTIESASFVSPKWVLQMGDAVEVMTRLERQPGVNYPVLVPNLKGYQSALKCKVEEVAIFPAASEGFSRKNLNCSVEESLARFGEVALQAARDGVRVRGYISCVVGCPYDGPVKPAAVAKVAERLLEMGCYELSLGDTIGVGTAGSVRALLRALAGVAGAGRLALHCHDTYGQGLANTLVGLDMGITTVDTSISGLGGCPYARGATGNLATEDLVYALSGLGAATGADLPALVRAGRAVCARLGTVSRSRVNRALGDRLASHEQLADQAACRA